jgi:hypothetical protein
MDYKSDYSAKEESLIGDVLDGKLPDEAIDPLDADFVRDIRFLKQGIESIEDEDPPWNTVEKILAMKSKRPLPPGLWNWLQNPFALMCEILVMIVFFTLVLLYFIK